MENEVMTEQQGRDVFMDEILQLIPHRYPFLLIDKVEDMIPNEKARGIKNVTVNEPFFQGHFPKHPVMPGVLILEAMAQTAAVTVSAGLPEGEKMEDYNFYFLGMKDVKFRKLVVPGDTLVMEIQKKQYCRHAFKFAAVAKVNGEVATEALLTAMIVKKS